MALVLALRITQLSHVYFEKIFRVEVFLSDLPESIFKAWFSYVGKIPDDREFYFLPTDQDKSDNRHNSVSDSLPMNLAGNGKCAKN